MLIEKSLQDYLSVAASGEEVPGGGSVSAVVAGLGVAMGEMVANFTAGKKKYAEFDAEVRSILAELSGVREELLKCVDRDAEAFLKFNDVYAMPKGDAEEKAARDKAMQACLFGALQPPMEIMRLAAKAVKFLPALAKNGNKNLITDAGVSALALLAGVKSARYNVLINLKWLKDKEEVKARRLEVDNIIAEVALTVNEVELLVEDAVS